MFIWFLATIYSSSPFENDDLSIHDTKRRRLTSSEQVNPKPTFIESYNICIDFFKAAIHLEDQYLKNANKTDPQSYDIYEMMLSKQNRYFTEQAQRLLYHYKEAIKQEINYECLTDSFTVGIEYFTIQVYEEYTKILKNTIKECLNKNVAIECKNHHLKSGLLYLKKLFCDKTALESFNLSKSYNEALSKMTKDLNIVSSKQNELFTLQKEFSNAISNLNIVGVILLFYKITNQVISYKHLIDSKIFDLIIQEIQSKKNEISAKQLDIFKITINYNPLFLFLEPFNKICTHKILQNVCLKESQTRFMTQVLESETFCANFINCIVDFETRSCQLFFNMLVKTLFVNLPNQITAKTFKDHITQVISISDQKGNTNKSAHLYLDLVKYFLMMFDNEMFPASQNFITPTKWTAGFLLRLIDFIKQMFYRILLLSVSDWDNIVIEEQAFCIKEDSILIDFKKLTINDIVMDSLDKVLLGNKSELLFMFKSLIKHYFSEENIKSLSSENYLDDLLYSNLIFEVKEMENLIEIYNGIKLDVLTSYKNGFLAIIFKSTKVTN